MDERLEILQSKNLLDVPLTDENIKKINSIFRYYHPNSINLPMSFLLKYYTDSLRYVGAILDSGLSKDEINNLINKIGEDKFIDLLYSSNPQNIRDLYNTISQQTDRNDLSEDLYRFIKTYPRINYKELSVDLLYKMMQIDKKSKSFGDINFFDDYLVNIFNTFGENINEFFKIVLDNPSFDIFQLDTKIMLDIYNYFRTKGNIFINNTNPKIGVLILEFYERYGVPDFQSAFPGAIISEWSDIPNNYKENLDSVLEALFKLRGIEGLDRLKKFGGYTFSKLLNAIYMGQIDVPKNLDLAFQKALNGSGEIVKLLNRFAYLKTDEPVFDYLVENYPQELWHKLYTYPSLIGLPEDQIEKFEEDKNKTNEFISSIFGVENGLDLTQKWELNRIDIPKNFYAAYEMKGLGDFIIEIYKKGNYSFEDVGDRFLNSNERLERWKENRDVLNSLNMEDKLRFLFPEENAKFKNLNPVYFILLDRIPLIGHLISEKNIEKYFDLLKKFEYHPDSVKTFAIFQDSYEKIKENWHVILGIFDSRTGVVRRSEVAVENMKDIIIKYTDLFSNKDRHFDFSNFISKNNDFSNIKRSPREWVEYYLVNKKLFNYDFIKDKPDSVLTMYVLSENFGAINPDRIEENYYNLNKLKSIYKAPKLMQYLDEDLDDEIINNYFVEKFNISFYISNSINPISKINLNNFIRFYLPDGLLGLRCVFDVVNKIINEDSIFDDVENEYYPPHLFSLFIEKNNPGLFNKTSFYRSDEDLFPIVCEYPELIGINKDVLREYFIPTLGAYNEIERFSFARFLSVFDKQLSSFNIQDLFSSDFIQATHDYNSLLPIFDSRSQVKYLGPFMIKYKKYLENMNMKKIIANWKDLPDEIKSTLDFDIINNYYLENIVLKNNRIENVKYRKLLLETSFWGQEEQYEKIEELYSLGQKVPLPKWANIKPVETKNYKGYFLPRSDFRTMFIGNYVTCCQAIGDHAQSSAIHSQISPFGALFVVENKKKSSFSAQSWVWSNGNTIVFDNIESPAGKEGVSYNEKAMNEILEVYKMAAVSMKNANDNQGQVLIGNSIYGIKQSFLEGFPRNKERLKPEDGDKNWVFMNDYYDEDDTLDDDYYDDDENPGGTYKTEGGLYLDSYFNTVKIAKIKKNLIRIANSVDKYATDIADRLENLVKQSV